MDNINDVDLTPNNSFSSFHNGDHIQQFGFDHKRMKINQQDKSVSIDGVTTYFYSPEDLWDTIQHERLGRIDYALLEAAFWEDRFCPRCGTLVPEDQAGELCDECKIVNKWHM